MNTTTIPFNVNNYVRVRLTDKGRALHRKSFDNLMAYWGGACPIDYTPPEEDAEGWSRWQLWDLMEKFGAAMGNGANLVFKTDIIIEVP